MADPVTVLAGVATNVLVESVKWLFTKAADALKQWRERRDAEPEGAAPSPKPAEAEAAPPVDPAPPEIIEGKLAPLEVDAAAMERLSGEIKDLRRALGDYAEGIEEIRPDDAELLETADGLRRLLEAVYNQRITFKGEDRPPSGPIVEGTVDVGKVQGHAAAVKARLVRSGRIRAEAKAESVEKDAELYGVEVDEIG